MNDADAERVRTYIGRTWKPDMRCASCAGSPTCPMLRDLVWTVAWNAFCESEPHLMPSRQLTCSRPLLCAQLVDSRHAAQCEMTTGRLRQLLCLECAERALGRQLTLDDLEPCVGNYAHYVMQGRATAAETQPGGFPEDAIFTHCGATGFNGALCTAQGWYRNKNEFTPLPGTAHDRGRHRDDSSDEEWEIK